MMSFKTQELHYDHVVQVKLSHSSWSKPVSNEPIRHMRFILLSLLIIGGVWVKAEILFQYSYTSRLDTKNPAPMIKKTAPMIKKTAPMIKIIKVLLIFGTWSRHHIYMVTRRMHHDL